MTNEHQFDYWVLRHPGRLAVSLGLCSNGQVITNRISEVINLIVRAEGAMPKEPKEKSGEQEQAKKTSPEEKKKPSLEDALEDAPDVTIGPEGVKVKPGQIVHWLIQIGKQIPWDEIYDAIQEARKSSWKSNKIEALLQTSLGTLDIKHFFITQIESAGLNDPAYSAEKTNTLTRLNGELNTLQTAIKRAKAAIDKGDEKAADGALQDVDHWMRVIQGEINALMNMK